MKTSKPPLLGLWVQILPFLLLLGLFVLHKQQPLGFVHGLALKFGLGLSLLSLVQYYMEKRIKKLVAIEPLYSYMIGFLLRLFALAAFVVILFVKDKTLLEPKTYFVITLLGTYLLVAMAEVLAISLRRPMK